MSLARKFFRSIATGNGSEVILPWFPEHDRKDPKARLIRASRREPEGSSFVLWPLASILWMGLSASAAYTMCRQNGKITAEQFGVNRLQQFLQMLWLALRDNVSPLDYHECQFYLPENRREAAYYLPPVRHGRLTADLNRNRPSEILDNKLRSFQAFRAAGLPTVDIVEIFKPDGSREFGRTNEELASYIGQDFFVKPVNLFGGKLAERWLYDAHLATYTNGQASVAPDDLWNTISNQAAEWGKDRPDLHARIVQPLLQNHPDLKPLSNESLNTLRVCTIRFPDNTVETLYAELRMGAGNDVSDTGDHSIAGVLDLQTGCLTAGLSIRKFNQRFPQHPDTGAQIEGFAFPLWKTVEELTHRAHKKFPENPIVGWDIAVTPEGATIVESNCNPYMNVPQVGLNMPLAHTRLTDLFWSWMSPS